MKKFIFLFIIILISIGTVKAETWFGGWEKIESMTLTFKRGNEIYSNYPFLFRMEDGKIVYCVKPFTQISHDKPYIEYTYNDNRFNLSESQLEKIKLYAYYGYNYPGHEDIKWFGITQFLIWKTFNLDDIYFTDYKGGNKINKYDSDINEIESLVNKHYILPSFSGETLEYKNNTRYELTDYNNVLQNYLIDSNSVDAVIDDNKLIINTTEDGSFYIEFKRKRNLNNEYILYGVDEYQDLFYPGGVDSSGFRINVEVNTGSILIEKKDSENLSRKEAKLSGAVYSIIKNGEEIKKVNTDENGMALIENLDLGEYIVKEEIASTGYTIDNNIYYVNLTKENKLLTITSYEKIIKGNVKITKYFGEKNNYELEDNAKFELYDLNNNFIKTYKTKNGVVEDTLPYGKYYLKQVEGEDGYNYVENYCFSIDKIDNYLIDLYNDPIKGNIVLTKYYGEENNYELEDNAKFELYDINNNFLKTYETENGVVEDTLTYGKYYLKQVEGKEGYSFIQDYYFNIDKEEVLNINLYNDKEENELVVEVPNTGVNNKKHYSVLIILIGIILIFKSKKTTLIQ